MFMWYRCVSYHLTIKGFFDSRLGLFTHVITVLSAWIYCARQL